ncbi:MAG: type IV toxin-antitoxin system AbiEi family antitoxin domain-containing protein [Actinobacteria bacterium]|nr:type IV toxin-antitoxin system AbiEi family antitoxin domain-containing protein [Actinomycetota bacterium]
MVTREMSDIEFIQTLRSFNKPYFTLADLEKILRMQRDSLYVTLNRLVKDGVLIRLKRGVYQPEFQGLELERAANELYYPSYISFESALSRYGILSQIPYTMTFATTRRSKKILLAEREVKYRQLKKKYFFGYKLDKGIYIAEPEKAILDQLYMMSKGKASNDMSEWSLVGLKKNKFLQYSKSFPETVRILAGKLISRFGKHVVTLDEGRSFQVSE